MKKLIPMKHPLVVKCGTYHTFPHNKLNFEVFTMVLRNSAEIHQPRISHCSCPSGSSATHYHSFLSWKVCSNYWPERILFSDMHPLEQWVLFRIHWFAEDNLEHAIEIWCFTVHVCRVASILIILARLIHQVAKENRTKASLLTVNSLMRNINVDNFLHRLNTIKELRKLYRENKQLFMDSGFKLTKE